MLYIACCSQKHSSLVMVKKTAQMDASDMLLHSSKETLAVQVKSQGHCSTALPCTTAASEMHSKHHQAGSCLNSFLVNSICVQLSLLGITNSLLQPR